MRTQTINASKLPDGRKIRSLGASLFAVALMVLSLTTSCEKDDEAGSLPTTETIEVAEISDVDVIVNGEVTSNGGTKLLAMGVCWIPGSVEPTVDDNFVPVGEYTQNGILEEDWDYSIKLSGLSAETEYSVRSYAANSAGVSYGETITFMTKAGKTLHALTADMIETHVQEPYEGPKEGLVDGDPGTYWHSAWSVAGAELPAHIQINFDEEKSIGGFTFMTRFSGANGNDPGQFDVQTSTDGMNFTTVWESAEIIDALVQPSVNDIALDKNYTSKYFRIRILNTRSRTGTCTHMAELEVFEDGLLPY
ncbi:discoidin domain-containing protein [Carboxylicivirga sp. N1Y90]|uniref:discoidin domain-containing protein n=1 Tax=Carboxylicivirga fragile TaxID=3417571 RepID=UPI003D335533|nr:discoidin domain-containing protein [Marinilabiliaceae bacterium N1Y90]